jgi:hypothetical protein
MRPPEGGRYKFMGNLNCKEPAGRRRYDGNCKTPIERLAFPGSVASGAVGEGVGAAEVLVYFWDAE